ncbi:Uncharacterized protein dnm_071740 [Desulfonema magnum]|uniref:Uncharacterized protein n=1 Tax=Desulfonema magnum TaxID=45655 RepID=A0A975GRK7_9BACT|nr:Uncharacterized protein dnm_071740 [Desulfonema magnum]
MLMKRGRPLVRFADEISFFRTMKKVVRPSHAMPDELPDILTFNT